MLERTDYLKGVFIDVCPKCQGIWLDGGEIHKLRDRSLVNLADKIYYFKTAFVTNLQLLFKGRDAIKKNQDSENNKDEK